MRGLDVSFSRINRKWAEQRLTDGWRLFIQCAWLGGYGSGTANNDAIRQLCAPNLQDARLAGMQTVFYTNVSPWRTPELWLTETMRNAASEADHVAGIIIDHEIYDTTSPDVVVRDEHVARYIDLLRAENTSLGMYSADWFVGGHLIPHKRRTTWGLPYWYANYSADPNVRPEQVKHPLGPVKARQYQGSTNIDGVVVDLNVFDDNFFTATKEDDMLTPEQEKKLDDANRKLDHILGPGDNWIAGIVVKAQAAAFRAAAEHLDAWADSIDNDFKPKAK